MNKKNIIIFFHPIYTLRDRITDLLYHFKNCNIYFLLDDCNVDKKNIELLEVYKKNKQIFFYKIINFSNGPCKPIKDIEYEQIKSVVKKDILLICQKLGKIDFDEIVVSDNTTYEIKYIINSLQNSRTIISYYCNTNVAWTIFPQARKNKQKKKLSKLGPLKYLIYKLRNEIKNFRIKFRNAFLNFQKILLFNKIIIVKDFKYLKISLDHNCVDKIYYFDENQKIFYERIILKEKIYPFNINIKCNLNNHYNNILLYCVDVFKYKNMHEKVISIVINDLTKILKANNNINKIIIKPHPREASNINYILVKKINDTFKINTSLFDPDVYGIDNYFCNFVIYYGGASTLINIAFEKCKKIKIYYSKKLSHITNPYSSEYVGLDKLKNKDRFFIID